MSEYLNTIKKAGVKLTRPRTKVLEVLEEAGRPMSIKEIHKETHKTVDLASVYRTVSLFLELGIVCAVPLGEGYQRYSLFNKAKHHHYVLCVECGKLENVDICLLDRVEKMTDFKILSHSMEFQGICGRCKN